MPCKTLDLTGFLIGFKVIFLTFMSRKNFMLNYVEHDKSFITSGPGLSLN